MVVRAVTCLRRTRRGTLHELHRLFLVHLPVGLFHHTLPRGALIVTVLPAKPGETGFNQMVDRIGAYGFTQ